MSTIYFRLQGEYGFLSNFYIYPFIYKNLEWRSAEHAYQAEKSPFLKVQEHIRQQLRPNQAKRLGRTLELRQDWDNIKLDIMENVVSAKFKVDFLKERLKNTGNCILVEYTTWNDTFYGVNTNYQGENHLGKILMKVRDAL